MVKYKLNDVGIDALGIEREQSGHENLKHVEEGTYKLITLPLKIQSVEAGLVRAILIQEE